MFKPTIPLAALLVYILAGCHSSSKEYSVSGSMADSINNTTTYKKFFPGNKQRKLIRTANLKFKVANVNSVANKADSVVNGYDGFIISSEIKHNKEFVQTIAVNEDSSLTTTSYSVTGDIIFRLPDENLEDVLHSIEAFIDFPEFKTIKAQDISLQMQSATRTQTRLKKQDKLLTGAISENKKDLSKTTDAIALVGITDKENDDAELNYQDLIDKVDYSTVTLSLYQNPIIRKEITPIIKPGKDYTPGFLYRIGTGFMDGWKMVEEFLVVLSKLWVLIILALAGLYIWKRNRKLTLKIN